MNKRRRVALKKRRKTRERLRTKEKALRAAPGSGTQRRSATATTPS